MSNQEYLKKIKGKTKTAVVGVATLFATMGSMNASAQEQNQDQKLKKEYNTFVKALPANMQEQIKSNPEVRDISWKMFIESNEKNAAENQDNLKDNQKTGSGTISAKEDTSFQELRSQVLRSRYLTDDNEYCIGGYLNEKGELVGGCSDSDRDFARQQADAELKSIYLKSLQGVAISAEELAIFDLKQEQGNLSRNVRDEEGRIVASNKSLKTTAPIKKMGMEK